MKYLQRVTLDGKPLPPLPRLEAADDSGSGARSQPRWFSGDYQYDSSGKIRRIGATTPNSDGKSNVYVYDSAAVW